MCTLVNRLLIILSALFSILATPLRADVVADPSFFDGWALWGMVLIGETRTGSVTLRNEGDDPDVITGVVLNYSLPSGFSIQTVPLPKTLAPAEETAIDITFRPTFDSMTMGQVTAFLGKQDPLIISLTAMAMRAATETSCDDGLDNDMNSLTDCADPACQDSPFCVADPLVASPSEISFRDVIAGTDEFHEVTVAIRNVSEVPVSITEYSFSDSINFTYAIEPGFIGELAAGQTFLVYLVFDPQTPGEHSADFNIGYSIGSSTGELVIPLDGTGLPAGNIKVTPAAHDFGYQYPKSGLLEVSVRNMTSNPILLEDIRLISEAFSIHSESACTSGMTLPGGGGCQILVQFVPADINAEVGDTFTGELIITEQDPDGRETIVDLTGMVPESAWISSHILLPGDDVPILADGLDFLVNQRFVHHQYENIAHLCIYKYGYLRYLRGTPDLGSSWTEPFGPIDYIAPTSGKVIDCAIAVMQESDYPEIAYLVDDGEFVTIYHRDLFRPASNFVRKVRYEGATSDRDLEHAEITLEKDSLDRTHLAFSVEVVPKPRENDLSVNGQITRVSPVISWDQSAVSYWGFVPLGTDSVGPDYLGPHPFIGAPESLITFADGIFLAFPDNNNFNMMRGSNLHMGTRGYQWDWQDIDASALAQVGGNPMGTRLHVASRAPEYFSVASINGAEGDVTLKNGRYNFFSDAVEEYTEILMSPLDEGVCKAEEADSALNYKEFANDTDYLLGEQIIFSDPASGTVRFINVDNSYPVQVLNDAFDLLFNQSSQYTETVGPLGSDLQITSLPPSGHYVAYKDTTGELVFAKRVGKLPPSPVDPAYAITLSPMRETFTALSPDTDAFKVFMLHNHAPETIYIDVNKLKINARSVDDGKWVLSGCAAKTDGFYTLNTLVTATLPFCVVLMETPTYPVAYLEVTTEGGNTVSAELIAQNVLDSDGDGLPDYVEIDTGTDPFDADTDDDGLEGGSLHSEDLNANGIVDPGETDPRLPDTDGDGLFDGLEKGLTEPQTPDTDITAGFFTADADPSSMTDPTRADTDGDSLGDGEEDANHNGAFEPELGETNPNLGDTDGDGVDDSMDLCPNDPDKTEPGSQGCGNLEDIIFSNGFE